MIFTVLMFLISAFCSKPHYLFPGIGKWKTYSLDKIPIQINSVDGLNLIHPEFYFICVFRPTWSWFFFRKCDQESAFGDLLSPNVISENYYYSLGKQGASFEKQDLKVLLFYKRQGFGRLFGRKYIAISELFNVQLRTDHDLRDQGAYYLDPAIISNSSKSSTKPPKEKDDNLEDSIKKWAIESSTAPIPPPVSSEPFKATSINILGTEIDLSGTSISAEFLDDLPSEELKMECLASFLAENEVDLSKLFPFNISDKFRSSYNEIRSRFNDLPDIPLNVDINIGQTHSVSLTSSTPEPEECSICLDTLRDNVYCLHGMHKFHKDCIKEWLERSPRCPLCNENISEDKIAFLTE